MASSVSLRRSLRKIPAFRSLPRQELEKVVERLACKVYKPGDVLWRTSSQVDFYGILQTGEIVLEYRMNGALVRSTRLVAGDIVTPLNLQGASRRSVVLAYAATDVRFYVLRMEQTAALQSSLSNEDLASPPKLPPRPSSAWNMAWIAGVAILIMLLSWNDMTRIASGMLYLGSTYLPQTAYQNPKPIVLLEYARSVDSQAVFVQNREGYLWYQQNDLKNAQLSFGDAVSIAPDYGPALNNLAVTYFESGQSKQAEVLQFQAVKNDPDSAVTHYNLGLTLMKRPNNGVALQEFREASYINPAWVFPYIEQGFNYLQMQNYGSAERAAREAIKLDPSQGSAHLILAIALYCQDKNQEGLQAIQAALLIDPNDRIARFYQARILKNLGEFDSAALAFHQLLKSTNDQQEISQIESEIEALHRSQHYTQVGDR